MGVARATAYRSLWPKPGVEKQDKIGRTIPRALHIEGRKEVLGILNSERFVDKSPQEVYTTLLDEGTYHCSVRTMYRILTGNDEVKERRQIVQRPRYEKPELLATAPKQVWSWDITKLLGPQKWTYFYLYVLMDIFSRYVVGWLVAEKESAALAKMLMAESCEKQNIKPHQLTIHSDRGGPMKSQTVAQLYANLGIVRSLSRPSVSNDNPFSESQFKTAKYHPGMPERFGSIFDARTHCRPLFTWYNDEHHHSGISYFTPRQVHYGLAQVAFESRAKTLAAAFNAHPERFVKGLPMPKPVPTAVWINPPVVSKPQSENSDAPGHPTEVSTNLLPGAFPSGLSTSMISESFPRGREDETRREEAVALLS
jgi:putative transposase